MAGVIRWRNISKVRPHFKPDDNQIPKADHAEFSCREPVPSFSVFDGHHIHIVEDELHRQQAREKADGVRGHRIPRQDIPTVHLKKRSGSLWGMKCGEKADHLPHEIVECDDRTGDIQRGVEDVCEVICKGINLQRMRAARPLFVGCGRLVHLIHLSECVAYERRIRATSFEGSRVIAQW